MLLVEAVVVVAEEAAVEEDSRRDRREAARELGAAGGIAQEAVRVGEVVEALCESEDGN